MRAPAELLLLLLTAAGLAASVDPGQRFAAVDRVVEEAMESRGVPGVSVAIIDGFEVVHARGFGFAEPGRPVRVARDEEEAAASRGVNHRCRPDAWGGALGPVFDGLLTVILRW